MSALLLRLQRRAELSELGEAGGLFVVGQEGAQLLCAAPVEEGGTAISAYDLATEKLARLYVHSGAGRVVGASVDAGMALLAVTTEEQRSKEGDTQTFFKTSLVEVLPTGEAYRLNVRSQQIQRVQFVGSAAQASSRLFLFMIEGMFVRLYQMHSRRRAGGGVKITAQPVLLTELTKKFQWYHWDGQSERLYVLVNGALRCYAFGKKERLVWEVPLNDPVIDVLPRTYLGFCHYAHDGRALLHSAQRVTMVALGDGGGLCLCVQGTIVASGKRSLLPLTVYVLHHAARLTVMLPLSLSSSASSAAPLVCCVALGLHMLLVWAPGHAAVLLDVGLGHAPSASLCAFGSRAPPLPCLKGADDDCYLTPLVWSGAAAAAAGEGHLQSLAWLLHARSGTILFVEVDRAALLDVVASPGPMMHIQAMHAAVVHLRDAELYRQLMMHALSPLTQGVTATREVLAEYLVATTHLRLSQEGRVPASVLAVLPITTLPSLFAAPLSPSSSSSSSSSLLSIAASVMHGFVPVLSAKGELTLEPEVTTASSGGNSNNNSGGNASNSASAHLRASPARLPVGSVAAASPSSSSSPSSGASPGPGSPMLTDSPQQSSGVSRLVQLLFGRDDSDSQLLAGPQEGEGPEGAECVSVCDSWGARYEETLAELLYKQVEKEQRAKCLRHAKVVRRTQTAQVAQLYRCVLDASQVLQSEAATFRVLENLYCVLEEHSLPLPSGFASLFSSLGHRVLPPRVFLQYVERNVFYLTDAFIASVLPECSSPELRLMLVLRIRNLELLVQTLWQDSANCAHVVPHLVSLSGIVLPEGSHDVQLLESADDAFFLPLAIFKEHVRMRGGASQQLTDEMVAFVYDAVCAEVKKAFAQARN